MVIGIAERGIDLSLGRGNDHGDSDGLIGAVARGVGAVATWFAARRERSAMRRELVGLSDRDLADMGLSRCDLRYVFDKDFAVSRAAERAALCGRFRQSAG